MMTLKHPSYLAVDGGGTRCRLALRAPSGQMHVTETGSANVTTDLVAATQEILRGLDALAQISGLAVKEIAALPAYLGLAGITGEEMAMRLAAALPFAHTRIEDDRPAALRGVLGARDGMVAHCGTGSFIATQFAGQMRFVGGWGAVLGDEASAQWVGRQALARSLDVVDELTEASALSHHVLTTLGGGAGVVRFAATATPAAFGRFAPDVTRLADEGCAMSRAILQQAASHIATTLSILGWQDGLRICLTGGIGPSYAPYLPAAMMTALRDPEGQPLDGAIALAEEFVSDCATKDTMRRETHVRC